MIETSEHRGVPVLRMAHGKANALDIEFCAALIDRIECLERDGAPGFILTGRGSIFSAGVDLVRAGDGGSQYMRQFLPGLSRAFEVLFFYSGPVVTAINGHAIAGGCILACAGDRRLLVESARIGVPELAVGVPFPAVALETMRFATGSHRFQDLIYGAGTFHGDEAVARQLADRIVSPDALLDEAAAEIAKLNAVPRLTFETTKRQLRFPFRKRTDEMGAAYDATVIDTWAHEKTLETVRSYAARTLKK